MLTADNHNSVNGIRELARAGGAPVIYLPLDDELRVRPFELPRVERGLFAYPAQSNFSGVRHPLDWIDAAQRRGYAVLLDAAAFVPTSPLSLREVRPDFVTLSIYKISGYPTGVGALVCRHDALRALVRPSLRAAPSSSCPSCPIAICSRPDRKDSKTAPATTWRGAAWRRRCR